MNMHKLIFTECDHYKAGRKIKPKGVMVHSTSANNPNLHRYVGPDDGLLGKNAYNNHWNMRGVGASVHAFIGKLKDGSIATYQVLPWDYRAGHCYKGKNGSGNDTHIAFEICEDNLKDPVYFGKVYQEAVELTAMLCKMYNLDPMADGVVICHSEGYTRGIASDHCDVMHWFPKHGKSMDTFRADVKAILSEKTVTKEESGYTLNDFIMDVQAACSKAPDCITVPQIISKTVTLSATKNRTHAAVRAVQKRLYALGYTNVGEADGIAGAKFTSAVEHFQQDNDCFVDGEVAEWSKTWHKLLGME